MSWTLATTTDVVEVSSNLRQGDIDEAQAMYGVDPSEYLPLYYTPGRTWVLHTEKSGNFGLAGIAPGPLEGVGQVWMVSTDAIEDNQIEFLRGTKGFLEEMHEYYDILFNYVDARQEMHLKWLKWSGFKAVNRKGCWGVAGIPFYEMVRIKECVYL